MPGWGTQMTKRPEWGTQMTERPGWGQGSPKHQDWVKIHQNTRMGLQITKIPGLSHDSGAPQGLNVSEKRNNLELIATWIISMS